jgi:hypothetical protein
MLVVFIKNIIKASILFAILLFCLVACSSKNVERKVDKISIRPSKILVPNTLKNGESIKVSLFVQTSIHGVKSLSIDSGYFHVFWLQRGEKHEKIAFLEKDKKLLLQLDLKSRTKDHFIVEVRSQSFAKDFKIKLIFNECREGKCEKKPYCSSINRCIDCSDTLDCKPGYECSFGECR